MTGFHMVMTSDLHPATGDFKRLSRVKATGRCGNVQPLKASSAPVCVKSARTASIVSASAALLSGR